MPEIARQKRSAHSGRDNDVHTISRVWDLPKITDSRGNLTFIEAERHVPFRIRRVYYTYDVPGGEARGGHAHIKCETFIIAASGSFDVVLGNGVKEERYFLNRSYHGVYVPVMTWRELDNFSSGSVCLVLASDYFDEDDYIRNWDDYTVLIGSKTAK